MPKLPRVTAKIFANNAPSDKIGQFGSAQSGTKVTTSDIEQIQALPAYETGWSSAVISNRNYPTLVERNGLDKTFSQQIAYLFQNGIAQWDKNTVYYTDCRVIAQNGKMYKSLTDENTANDPATDTSNWEEIIPLNNKITNSILEIPQRIKYSLENGVLTVKKGSVVIVPYGSEDKTSEFPIGSNFLNDNFKVFDSVYYGGKFFVWAQLQGDIKKKTAQNDSLRRLVSIDLKANDIIASLYHYSLDGDYSGSSACFNYNLTTNLISRYEQQNPSPLGTLCFPILKSVSDGVNLFAFVEQVFNGFGYIGTTVWNDKGIKGVFPCGRNEDESLKNYVWVCDKFNCYTYNLSTAQKKCLDLFFSANHEYNGVEYSLVWGENYEGSEKPTNSSSNAWYNPRTNLMKFYRNDAWKNSLAFKIGGFVVNPNKYIENFEVNNTISLADKSELDGFWVGKALTLASSEQINAKATKTYDLSSYLPDDNNVYEVMVSGRFFSNNVLGNYLDVTCASSILKNVVLARICSRAAGSFDQGISTIIPVGKNRTLSFTNNAPNPSAINGFSVYLTGYRKVR